MDKGIVLYSTGCPQCKVLEAKLKNKNIDYTTITDVEIMKAKGFTRTPILEVEGRDLCFTEAVAWVNER